MAPTPRKSTSKPTDSLEAFAAVAAEDSANMPAEMPTEMPTEMPIEIAAEAAVEMPAEPAAEIHASAAEEFQAGVRKVAEQSLEQSRTAFDRLRAAAEAATGSFETSYSATTKGLTEFNVKAIDALKCNADATFDLMKALMSVKTLSEAITLQTEHARKQFEALSAQSKDLAEIAKKMASEATDPLKSSVATTFGKAA